MEAGTDPVRGRYDFRNEIRALTSWTLLSQIKGGVLVVCHDTW
jgi:hypothetical protein